MSNNNFDELVINLKGIGEKTSKLFEKCGVKNIGNLLIYYPRCYDSYDKFVNVSDVIPGQVNALKLTIIGNIARKRVRNLSIVSFEAADQTGKIKITYFNAPYLANSLKSGTTHIFRGMVQRKGSFLNMDQPKMYKIEEYAAITGKLQPRYPLIKGLSNNIVIKTMEQAFINVGKIEEFVPEDILNRLNLIGYAEALRNIHFPKNADMLEKARRRLAYNEFLIFVIRLRLLKQNSEEILNSFPMKEEKEVKRLLENLPYRLTNAQMQAFEDIKNDLIGTHVMNRLIQGDVGSGKTILALLSLLTVAGNGFQGALMAPTEVLAAQHYESFKEFIEKYDLNTLKPVLLTGSLSAKEKKEAQRQISEGEVNCIIGTNALIQAKVNYKNLALVVTDEQHRFGVRQREALAGKGVNTHILAMSATPIPRTLAIILYGDLHISIINELPGGRLPIKNCVVGTEYRPKAYKFIQDQVNAGRQAYVICPMIEEGEVDGLTNVTDYVEILRENLSHDIRIEMLHGKMKPAQKDEIMEAFARKEIDVLVSTTVIEVGINVPNATVMMIENSERFGLSQLHQLRGRVGRGKYQSYCIFINTSEGEDAKKRLDIMNKTNDGFKIAEEDLQQRGPGDLFGIRQSGDLNFRIGDIYHDSDLVRESAVDADKILFEDPDLSLPQHRVLKGIMDTKSANLVDFASL
ncbi:ATP-dependent DNA helicase RecG [Butyrivibrio sp. YAB3001]|uniref:ATP-dependent DNA helicase RecG n=1 Tax=Butyrivibrio sp. YAB3001 TaxID=1520812 RepID=UPI0008F6217D|nr:ATP-dependent DNA helicase RecG [Butyrivibrio sp. YAB3001]SFB67665.1 ATP-dependent DNA helicase RecG [Butyrivibrio sp. YAB3001]